MLTGFRQKARFTVGNDPSVDPNWGRNYGATDAHALDELVPTLPALPWGVRERHDTDMELLHLPDLIVFAPTPGLMRHIR
jgi:hypothetical protein